DRVVVQVADLQAEENEFPRGAAFAREFGHRSTLAAPLLQRDVAIGAILIRRMVIRPFSERQIELLKAFADQAAIAINTARLFEEVEAGNRDLTALGEVGRAVSSTLDLKAVLKTIVARAVTLSGTDLGLIFRYHEQDSTLRLEEAWGLEDAIVERIRGMHIP